jgi:hypothetical protein
MALAVMAMMAGAGLVPTRFPDGAVAGGRIAIHAGIWQSIRMAS